MPAFLLPVGRRAVRLREPRGQDQIMLAEVGGAQTDIELRVETLRRLAPPIDSEATWDEFAAADVDPAFLALRRSLHGDRIVAEIVCRSCGGRGDIHLSITQYLSAHAPRPPRASMRDGEGWWRIDEARFRLPLVADLIDAARQTLSPSERAALIEERCVDAGDARSRRRVCRALERQAPVLNGELIGACFECKATVTAWFDPAAFVLAEFAQAALAVFEEVHLLARTYGWGEQVILDLPAGRRGRYAALVAAQGLTAADRRIFG
jgi:hypothetical protein